MTRFQAEVLALMLRSGGEGNGAHSSTLAWKIPWTEKPGGLQSMGSQRVIHDWATSLSLFTFMHWRGNGNPLQCSCLESPRDGGAWWAAVYGVTQSQTWLKWLSSSSSSWEVVLTQLGFAMSSGPAGSISWGRDLGQFEKWVTFTAALSNEQRVGNNEKFLAFYLNYLTGLLFLICFVFVLAIFCLFVFVCFD